MIGLKLSEILTHILSIIHVVTVLRRGSTEISENNLEAAFGKLKRVNHHMKIVSHCMVKIIRSSFLES